MPTTFSEQAVAGGEECGLVSEPRGVAPQPVVQRPTRHAIFLTLRMSAGAEARVVDGLTAVTGTFRAVEFRARDERLSVVVGIGAEAWDRLFDAPRPSGLHPFRRLDGGVHTAVSTPGDLLLHIRAQRADLCFELATRLLEVFGGAVTVIDEVHGFTYFDERDLLGFVDGTENPRDGAAVRAALIGADDPVLAGSSYVIVQKYVHDMEAWNALSIEEQEAAFGRHKLSDIEIPDEEKAPNAHLTLNSVTGDDGEERQILRENMPFGRLGSQEFGTYYIAYAADPSVTEQMLLNMFIGDPPGTYDRILDFSTALTGCLFFVPTEDFLDDPAEVLAGLRAQAGLPALPDPTGDGDATGTSATGDGDRAVTSATAPPADDGSLGIGGLRRDRLGGGSRP